MMDDEQIAVILSLISLIVGILAYFIEEYRIYLIIFGVIMILLYVVTYYFRKVDMYGIKLRKLEEKVNIYERLSKLEARVFKNE